MSSALSGRRRLVAGIVLASAAIAALLLGDGQPFAYYHDM
jgi:hypothetical protein